MVKELGSFDMQVARNGLADAGWWLRMHKQIQSWVLGSEQGAEWDKPCWTTDFMQDAKVGSMAS
eukprot:363678-Chlamydomonas_euryale.AAC.7